MRTLAHVLNAIGLIFLVGCSNRVNVAPPKYSPGATADAAMAEFDANKDGKLDEKELEKCPSLKSSLVNLDKNNNKAIDRDELEARLNEFLNSNVGLMALSCRLFKANQPLGNADVKFVPEKFHGQTISVATGKSDNAGNVELRCEGKPLAGLSLGFYRVEVSLKDAGGQETIPAAYNTQTTLGYQVSSSVRGAIEIKIP